MALRCSVGVAGLSARMEGSASLPLSSPQTQNFGVGGGGRALALLSVADSFDISAVLGTLYVTPTAASPEPSGGQVTFGGLGARYRLFEPERAWFPMAGLDLAYGRTGEDHLLGAHLTLGVMWRLSPLLAVGPLVQVGQFFPLNEVPGFAMNPATFLHLGAALEFGTAAGMTEHPSPPPVLPAPDLDSDKDGVLDENDKCPNQAGPRTNRGCPELDSDGDGVPDDLDRCPAQKEDRDNFQDEDGCPDPDNDKDGLADTEDQCPFLAGPASARGCPDDDQDGVPNSQDACPRVAGLASESGCPKYVQVRVTENRIEISQKIFFAFGKTTILPKSFALLDEVTRALKDRVGICVSVQGHTDSIGNATANRDLSRGRAQAVMTYLAEHGVEARRLGSEGYGPDLPADTNATSEGREKNRRVEFVIVPCSKEAP